MNRRSLLLAACAASAGPSIAYPKAAARNFFFDSPLLLSADGPILSPTAFTEVLKRSIGSNDEPDTYSEGGWTERLENYIAERLGKEAAMFCPTGTLANQIAIRVLSGDKAHVIVQDQSHVFRDEHDIAQAMSGKTLITAALGAASFSVEFFKDLLQRNPNSIGAVSIETPVRRLLGERFDFRELQAISAVSREYGVGTHLDGARIFLESAYTGKSVREYASLFDTVYICLYKHFGAGSGAVLCGSKGLIARAREVRSQFGATMFKSWPYAAVAMYFARGFEERFGDAQRKAVRLFDKINDTKLFRVEPIPNGTNVFRLRIKNSAPESFRRKMSRDGIRWASFGFTPDYAILRVNETWNRIHESDLVERMKRAAV